ncbi:hypothetical protein [Streptomyces sp. NBC_01518]|uniref:hypothetical protein n=1 Tax=Streptomyces sp. NBC_01518 TaxID=2903891 RepID=UPI003864D48E
MHATLTPYIIFTQKNLSDQGAGTALVSVVISAGFFVGGLTPLLSDRADRRVGYRVIVPVSLLTLAAALALSGFGLVWVTIAAFLILNEAVPSRHRASLLSMIAFVVGTLMDGLGSSAGMAAYTAVPLLACLLWLPVLFRGARVTTGIENPTDQKTS